MKAPDCIEGAFDQLLEIGIMKDPKVVVAEDGGDPFVLVPDGMEVKSLAGLVPLKRIERQVTLLTAESFSSYINRFKSPQTLIFANFDSPAGLTAYLDYHGAAPELIPGRCAHVARYPLKETLEWKSWMENDRKPMEQVAFASWIEENLKLFKDPAGADLLELVTTLEGKCDARFHSTVRMQTGATRLVFDEDVVVKGQSSTQTGQVDLPKTLTAGISPFRGAVPYAVEARLKVRVEARKIRLWYETIGAHHILRDAVDGIAQEVASKTEITPLLGGA